jgi:hypothetical protein
MFAFVGEHLFMPGVAHWSPLGAWHEPPVHICPLAQVVKLPHCPSLLQVCWWVESVHWVLPVPHCTHIA